jgi:2,3-dihydroxyphenylpropionate 1,2-dioxygenase
MASIIFGGALSHSPMMNYPIARDHAPVERFRSAVHEMGTRLRTSKPDAIVLFGPDHFRALFYDMMPAFAIGVRTISGWGDWNTPVGPFPAATALADHIVNTLLADGYEPAFSHELKVDHGITQPLQLMNLEDVPLIPIVVNAAAPPLPTPARCHAFGAAVGRAIRNAPQDLSVAVLASGGLSHDPPKPSEENCLHGRTNGFAASREREARLISKATVLQSRINPEWDRMVLDHFIGGEAGTLAANLTTESIFAAAGNGGQEIRTWFAAAGALNDARMDLLSYEPIDELITGMGVIVTS